MSVELTVIDDCWNRIGISGDRSCPELVEHIHCRNCPVFSNAARNLFDRAAPAGYLNDWTTALTAAVEPAEDDFASLFLFRLNQEYLGLRTPLLVEVTPRRPIHTVPHRTNGVFRGLVNIRGQLQLCLSLHGLLGLPQIGEEAAFLAVVEDGPERWVFAADEVMGVHRVPKSALRKVPGTLANPLTSFTQAVFTWEDHHVGYLEEQRLLSAFRSLGSA
jgi:chemotaxis-related protein WspD